MNVRELCTSWGFDIDTKPLDQMDASIAALKTSVKALVLEVSAVVGAVYAFVKTTADAGHEANDLAQSLGTTAQEIQRIQYAAHIAGASEGEMEMGLRRISMAAMAASKGGADANLMFSKLGISIYDSNGKMKSSTELLKDSADSFKRMPDGVIKTALAVELLGRTGTKLIPILNGGREALNKYGKEAEALGYVMGPNQIRMAVLFTEGLHKLELIFISLKRRIGDQLMPVFVELIDKFQKWYDENKAFIDSAITQTVQILANAFVNGSNAIMGLVRGVRNLLDMTGAMEHLKTILVVISGLFAAMTMMTAIAAIGEMINIVKKLVQVLRLAAVFEAIATGGASLYIGLAAGAAAMLATGYLMSNSGVSGGSESTVPAMPTAPGAPVKNSSNATQNISIQMPISVNTAPGTTAQQGAEMSKAIKDEMNRNLRNASAAFAMPLPARQ
jgi:hypothetical protein